MQIQTTLTEKDLRKISENLNIVVQISKSWITRQKKNGFTFTLSLGSSRRFQRVGNTGRKVFAVCYHGHYDFMKAVYDKDPNARIVSSMAKYENIESFELQAPELAYRNIGSIIEPLEYSQACLCLEK